MSWLVVLIAAPFASWGEDPGNARRGTADRPTRSALLGLAGAALGVLRDDREGQARLGAAFRTATKTLSAGAVLTDFHTFQSLPAMKTRVATRAEALARRDDLETSITRRDYRSDGLWQAAFGPGGAIPLEALRDAFLAPRFPLWAGRKSCPLAHPLAPLIARDVALEDAFAQHAATILGAGTAAQDWEKALRGESRAFIACDADMPPVGNTRGWRRRRQDEPGDRTRWHFAPRYERVYPLPPKEPEKNAP